MRVSENKRVYTRVCVYTSELVKNKHKWSGR